MQMQHTAVFQVKEIKLMSEKEKDEHKEKEIMEEKYDHEDIEEWGLDSFFSVKSLTSIYTSPQWVYLFYSFVVIPEINQYHYY